MHVRVAVLCGRGLAAADSNGFSDPYVKAKVVVEGEGGQLGFLRGRKISRIGREPSQQGEGRRGQSDVFPMTLNPHFGAVLLDFHCTPEEIAEQKNKIVFRVMDKDRIGSDFLGLCTLPLAVVSRCDGAAWLPLHTSPQHKPPPLGVTGEILVQWCSQQPPGWVGPQRVSAASHVIAEALKGCGEHVRLLSNAHQLQTELQKWRVIVRIVRGRNLAAADATGLSDPFVVMKFNNGKEAESNVENQTLAPHWSDPAEISLEIPQFLIHLPLEVLVEDKDRASTDFLGRAHIPVSRFISDGEHAGEQWVKLEPDQSRPTKYDITGEICVAWNTTREDESASLFPMHVSLEDRKLTDASYRESGGSPQPEDAPSGTCVSAEHRDEASAAACGSGGGVCVAAMEGGKTFGDVDPSSPPATNPTAKEQQLPQAATSPKRGDGGDTKDSAPQESNSPKRTVSSEERDENSGSQSVDTPAGGGSGNGGGGGNGGAGNGGKSKTSNRNGNNSNKKEEQQHEMREEEIYVHEVPEKERDDCFFSFLFFPSCMGGSSSSKD